jgi:hypothetical protein
MLRAAYPMPAGENGSTEPCTSFTIPGAVAELPRLSAECCNRKITGICVGNYWGDQLPGVTA